MYHLNLVVDISKVFFINLSCLHRSSTNPQEENIENLPSPGLSNKIYSSIYMKANNSNLIHDTSNQPFFGNHVNQINPLHTATMILQGLLSNKVQSSDYRRF